MYGIHRIYNICECEEFHIFTYFYSVNFGYVVVLTDRIDYSLIL